MEKKGGLICSELCSASTLGQRLRAVRKQLFSMTLAQFGEKFGIDISTMSKFETDQRRPNAELLRSIEFFTRIDIWWFSEGKIEPSYCKSISDVRIALEISKAEFAVEVKCNPEVLNAIEDYYVAPSEDLRKVVHTMISKKYPIKYSSFEAGIKTKVHLMDLTLNDRIRQIETILVDIRHRLDDIENTIKAEKKE